MKEFSGVPDKYCHLRIYRIYVGMHSRCENENCDHYGKLYSRIVQKGMTIDEALNDVKK